jgi:EAL and modified HD-GYP domain-containing signal transduction protein
MSIFVARQPIFDKRERLSGYELLYREDGAATSAGQHDSNAMSARVIANVFLAMDIKDITGGVPAFLNITGEQLLEQTYDLLDPKDVVIEVLETCIVDDYTFEAVETMVAAGYRIALDDFEPEQSNARLLGLASIVKIDVLGRTDEQIKRVVDCVRRPGITLLAERVETQEVYARCLAMGFELFQGYFHARPETVHAEDVEARHSSTIRLLNLLRNPNSSDAEIEKAFRADPALCYKLMRMVNSAAIGASEVDSVQRALRLVGRGTLYRWLSVLFTASFADGSDNTKELVLAALARGRLCELVANRSPGSPPSDAMFMTGLLSRIDALMRVPMERVLAGIQVPMPVHDALMLRTGAQAPALKLAEAYEGGDWSGVRTLASEMGLASTTVAGLYMDSIKWAKEQLGGTA